MLTPSQQIRFTKPQLEYLVKQREETGRPIGEQIRAILDDWLEANVRNAPLLDKILDSLPHGLPGQVEIHDLPVTFGEPLKRQSIRVRRR